MYATGRLAPVLKIFFINVSYHILVASRTLMALEPSELDWLQVLKHDPVNATGNPDYCNRQDPIQSATHSGRNRRKLFKHSIVIDLMGMF